ncbi:MAG: hypothetical protein MJZ64_00255 [Paludibacteraceae bacterium]|nr:hypothetical protein [Paludibacteraceae bacterium]
MDILYIIGAGSKWANNELRYSLRSVAKFGKNVGRIYVCGVNPGIISDKVTFIPCDDPYDTAHKNIQHKIDYAIRNSDIGEHFLLSSDDHFFVRDVDLDKYPLYSKGMLPDVVKKNEPYFHSLVETRQLLEQASLPINQTNPHCDTHITRSVWEKTADLRVAAMNLPHGGEVNCIIGNQLIADGMKCTPYRDVKVRQFKSINDLKRQIGDSHCFSIFDSAIYCGLEEYLMQLFPEQCEYELVSKPKPKSKRKEPRYVPYYVNMSGAKVIKYKPIYD